MFLGPFGEPLRATGPAAKTNPFRFSTKFSDSETGLVYYGKRYYQPIMGRWLSKDPAEERGGKNLYRFVQNRPTRLIDVDGLVPVDPDIGEVNDDLINCIGYACDLGVALKPNQKDTPAETLTKLGYKCEKTEASKDCKCDCDSESAVMVYMYLLRPRDWDKWPDGKKKAYVNYVFGGPPPDAWNTTWGQLNANIDIHAVRRNCPAPEGSNVAWDFVESQLERIDYRSSPQYLSDPDDLWKGSEVRVLSKQCCKKPKK